MYGAWGTSTVLVCGEQRRTKGPGWPVTHHGVDSGSPAGQIQDVWIQDVWIHDVWIHDMWIHDVWIHDERIQICGSITCGSRMCGSMF